MFLSRRRFVVSPQMADSGLLRYEKDKEYNVTATEILVFGPDEKMQHRKSLKAYWEVEIDPEGNLYASDSQEPQLKIYRIDPATGERTLHVELDEYRKSRMVDLDVESNLRWTIGRNENVFVLISKLQEGEIHAYSRQKDFLWKLAVSPEPKTSVAYMKDIFVDNRGFVYALHSSWEVSTSTANSGSIIKINPEGQVLYRIQKKIGYLQEIAVDGEGRIYSSSLGDTIEVYEPEHGDLMTQWNAVPPRFGESWQQMRERQAIANRADCSSSIEDFVIGVVYGEWQQHRKMEKCLLDRPTEALIPVIESLQKYPCWELSNVLSALIEQDPGVAMEQIVKYFDSGPFEMKKQLVGFVLRSQTRPDSLRSFLEQLASSGTSEEKESAPAALEDLGWASPISKNWMERLTDPQLSEQERWQVEWDFSQNFEEAFRTLTNVLETPSHLFRSEARRLLIQALQRHVSTSFVSNHNCGTTVSRHHRIRSVPSFPARCEPGNTLSAPFSSLHSSRCRRRISISSRTLAGA